MVVIIAVNWATAWKQSTCLLTSCLNVCDITSKFFNLLLIVSWRALILECNTLSEPWTSNGVRQYMCLYPLSPIIRSLHNFPSKELLKIATSFISPHLNGPLTHTIIPVEMHSAISYRKPGPFSLNEYHDLLKGLGSLIGQSVPSTEHKTFSKKVDPWCLSLHLICTFITVLVVCIYSFASSNIWKIKTFMSSYLILIRNFCYKFPNPFTVGFFIATPYHSSVMFLTVVF